MPSPDHVRQLLLDPRGQELSIGHALHALMDADFGRPRYSSLSDPFPNIRLANLRACEDRRDPVWRRIGDELEEAA